MGIDSLVLVGHGNMGSAMLARWRDRASASHIHVVSPSHSEQSTPALTWHTGPATLPAAQAVVFAVKPAKLAELLPLYRAQLGDSPLYISVAAGKPLSFYAQHLGAAPTVRAMPNTPSRIGRGVTLLAAATGLSAAHHDTATALMAALGETLWIDESQMDAAMAISGCGPAYLYLFAHSIEQAGIAVGLSPEQAGALTRHTLSGSLALAASGERSWQALWQEVASPGGATQAALDVLSAPGGLPDRTKSAIAAAVARAAELAKS